MHTKGESAASMQGLSPGKNKRGKPSETRQYSDGTDRKPKESQIKALDWLYDHDDVHVRILEAPTGAGKSFIAAAMAEPRTVIIVSDNIQLAQYRATYPDFNYLMGKALYSTDDEFEDSVKRLQDGEPTVTNQHAWVAYCRYRRDWDAPGPRHLILDEFHRLLPSLIGMSSGSFSKRTYPDLPITTKEDVLINYFSKLEDRLREKAKDTADPEKVLDYTRESYRAGHLARGLRKNYQDYVIDIRSNSLTITRFTPDPYLVNLFSKAPKITAMSATPRPTDKELLSDHRAEYITPSDIPAGQRPIQYLGVQFPMNFRTPASKLRPTIDKIMAKHRGQNGVIHVPYHRSAEIKQMYPEFIFHTSKDKDKQLKKFKEEGGVFIACGCAEGIDLPGDMARWQYVPWLLKPSLGDKWVKSRKAKLDGQRWYDWNVLMTFAQMAGRSTRGPNDWSTVYTSDPMISKLYSKYKRDLWAWFKDALILYTTL